MVRLIIWLVVGLLALSFFGISIRGLVESPTNQDNISFIWNLLQDGWVYIVNWFSFIPDFFKSLKGPW